MVSAWIYQESAEDPREQHKFEPNQPVSLEALSDIGVLYWSIDPKTQMDKVDLICKERNYASRDEVLATILSNINLSNGTNHGIDLYCKGQVAQL